MSSELEKYAVEEIATHRTPSDAWVIIHGKVYDVTKYQSDHPGGAAVLTEAAGTDASDDFDNAGHSEDAFDVMVEYCIGTVEGYIGKKERLKPVARTLAPATAIAGSTPSSRRVWDVAKLSSLGLLGLTVAFLYRTQDRQPIRLSPRILSRLYQDGQVFGKSHTFIKGLVAGGTIFASLTVFLARQFASNAWMTKNFTSYPPHMAMPKQVKENILLHGGLLSPMEFVALPLAEKRRISPNVYRFKFTLPTKNTVLGLPIGQHVAIKAEGIALNTQESITRSYTPVSNNSDLGFLELVVKIYPDGKLTQGYLANLQLGDKVLFRGPKGAMRYCPGLCKEIGMVAGGSGITPMFQIIRAVCEHEHDLTKISLIYANRTEDDILMREELEKYARRYPDQFKMFLMLDDPPKTGWDGGKGHVTKNLMAEKLPDARTDTKIMLCGPPGMVSAATRGLVELGFKAPGASAKMSDQIFLF